MSPARHVPITIYRGRFATVVCTEDRQAWPCSTVMPAVAEPEPVIRIQWRQPAARPRTS